MSKRVADLLATFPACLDAFESSKVFSGPSIHFHKKAVAARKGKSVAQAVNDTALLEAIYAMLASWGMHRMGPTGAKLPEFEDFTSRVREALPILVELESRHLATLSTKDVGAVAEKVWNAIARMRASETKTQIVAGSKTLHHLLPELLPPIDRTYTLKFFYGFDPLAGQGASEAEVFNEIFPMLRSIAADDRAHVSRVGPMYSSATKTIDNAIVGYVWRKKPRRKANG